MPNSAPLVSWRGEHAKMPLPLRIVGRYLVTGQSLRGPGDNATLFHRATVDYRARPYLTLTAPRWQRLARRNGSITVPVLLTAMVPTPYVNREAVAGYLLALVVLVVAWGVRRFRREVVGRRHNREWVDPAARRLCAILKRRYARTEARRMISIPKDWGQDREVGERQSAVVFMPEGTVLSKSIKTSIESNVGSALGIPAPIMAEWADNGSRVELFAAPLPPTEVTWADIEQAARECTDDEVIVGRKTGGHFVTVSLVDDAPHLAMSGAAGTGKSVLVRLILRQRIPRGDGVCIFDPKRFSHMRWANQFPPEVVQYAVTDAELHDGWLAVGQEMRRRIRLPVDELEGQRRVWLVAEEINAQVKILTRYWKQKRQEMMRPARALLSDCEKECGGSKLEGLALAEERDPDIMAKLDPPATSPAVVAMQESVFMGRELRMHVVAAAQRLSAGVFGGGGGDVRESFQGGRFMAKWDRKLWKMLADGIPYVAWPGGKSGVWGIARGEEFTIFRAAWLSDKDGTMAGALDSLVITGPVLGAQSGQPVVHGHSERDALVQGVKLSEAVVQLPGLGSLDSVRRASTRPGFPVAIGQSGTAKTYDLSELEAWLVSKP